MASYKEDERFKKDEFAQADEVPILDIGTQAVIGIERDYQKKDILESTDLGDHSADLGALPAFLTGASVSYYQLNWKLNEEKDLDE